MGHFERKSGKINFKLDTAFFLGSWNVFLKF